MLTRRELLIKSATLATALPAARLAAAFPATSKLQTIGIRPFDISPDNAVQTFHDLEATGFREMEVPYKDVEACWAVVRTSSMKKVSVYIDGTLTFPGKEDELSRTLDQVKKWGFSYASCSYRQIDEGSGVADKYRIFAERMNKAGARCRAAGLGALLYHNQIFEFQPDKGTTGYQALLDEQDKDLCALELDVYWVSLAGHDPAEYLRKLAGRVKIMHFKDKPAGLPPMYVHAPGPGNFLDVGEGSLDWPSILRAAAASHVEHYIVEPDARSASDMVMHARKSFQYLSSLEY
jgi:hypothetical protein